jgi:hypothetical protein
MAHERHWRGPLCQFQTKPQASLRFRGCFHCVCLRQQ